MSNESDKLLEGVSFGPDGVEYRIPFLLNGISDKSRHVIDINGADPVATVARNRKRRKMADEPRDVVDENVFETEDDGGPENRVGQTGLDDRLLQLCFPL